MLAAPSPPHFSDQPPHPPLRRPVGGRLRPLCGPRAALRPLRAVESSLAGMADETAADQARLTRSQPTTRPSPTCTPAERRLGAMQRRAEQPAPHRAAAHARRRWLHCPRRCCSGPRATPSSHHLCTHMIASTLRSTPTDNGGSADPGATPQRSAHPHRCCSGRRLPGPGRFCSCRRSWRARWRGTANVPRSFATLRESRWRARCVFRTSSSSWRRP